MAIDKDFFNRSSSDSLGWDPSWFGAEHFDEALIAGVRRWQKLNDLLADGLVGPMTYRRIWTERQSEISNYMPSTRSSNGSSNFIVHNGEFLPIDWGKVVLWDEPNGLSIKSGNYYDNSGKPDRKPTMFVNHWDVCLSAESCATVLNKRGISVHFCLDNDGTIYQLLDTQHGAWHCGKHAGNKASIGIEISNAYYPKYQDWYIKNGFGERPIMSKGEVHGKTLDPFTWFYPAQIEALKALWKAIHMGVGIPLDFPKNDDGALCTTTHKGCEKGSFEGFCNHYNLVRTKIDCAGLNVDALLGEVAGTLSCEDI